MTTAEWLDIGWVDQIPVRGSRTVQVAGGDDIAVFRTAEDEIFALRDQCPHRGGPLSQGIVHGKRVSCPLHNWQIGLDDGQAAAPDHGHCARFEVKLEDGQIYLAQDPIATPT